MLAAAGVIALIGSGELTGTMVEVHKSLLNRLRQPAEAVFLDTPAGFQLNIEQIAAAAGDYFLRRVQHPLQVVSYRSNQAMSEYDKALACNQLRGADYILLGPGSPSYTVRQLKDSPVPGLLSDCLRRGGSLAVASAAALAMSAKTLPVYEIYKVGEELQWLRGLDLLGEFGLELVVIPHWNNAEGGSHDTSRCFMGESRFASLRAMLSPQAKILGIDEHTACVIDLGLDTFEVKGLGSAHLLTAAGSYHFLKGKVYPLSFLRGEQGAEVTLAESPAVESPITSSPEPDTFWNRVCRLEAEFTQALDFANSTSATRILLEFDRLLWAGGEATDASALSEARDRYRDLLVRLGTDSCRAVVKQQLTPLVDLLLEIRQQVRDNQQWALADAIRERLRAAGIDIVDGAEGSSYTMNDNWPGPGSH